MKVCGSVTDCGLVAKGAEVVMHLAAAFREIGAPDSVYRQVNVGGTRIIAEVYRSTVVRHDFGLSGVLEQATGLVGLVLLALLGCLFMPSSFANPLVAIPMAMAVCVTALGVFAFFRPALTKAGLRVAGRLPLVGRVTAKAHRLLSDIDHYRGNRRLLVNSLALSFLFHFVAAENAYVACLAIDFQPSFLAVMVVTAVILLLSMIPVSPNNIGWWVFQRAARRCRRHGGAGARGDDGALSLLGGLLLLRDRRGAAGS